MSTRQIPIQIAIIKLLPVVVTVVALLGVLGAVRGLARLARGGAHDVVARLTISLRLFVVGLACLVWLQETLLRGLGWWLDRC
jgi:hypothetical protein